MRSFANGMATSKALSVFILGVISMAAPSPANHQSAALALVRQPAPTGLGEGFVGAVFERRGGEGEGIDEVIS